MKTFLLYVVFLFCSKLSLAQEQFFKYPIYIDINNQYIYSFNKTDSVIVSDRSSSESSTLKLYDFDSVCRFKFIFYDSINNQKIQGSYLIGTKIKKIKQSVIPVGSGGITKRKLINFYFKNAVRSGTWVIYDDLNVIKKTIDYGGGCP